MRTTAHKSTKMKATRSKGEREAEDTLEKDCRERTGQGSTDEFEYGQKKTAN